MTKSELKPNPSLPAAVKSTIHKNIHHALLASQSAIEPVIKSAENETFQSSYADLHAVVAAIRPALNGNGIVFFHAPFRDENGQYMRTTLFHAESETKLDCDVPLIMARNDMQSYKSATTYAKRIGLESLTGIAPEDDDGNAASGRDKPDARQQRREQAAETARTQPAAPIPPAHSNAPATPPVALGDDWWKSVVCHVGKVGGDMIDKPVGELRREHLDWIVENVKARTVKGTNLLNAAKAALAAMPKEEAAPAETPPDESDNLDLSPAQEPEKAAPPAIAWREVVTHSIGKILGGKKLGDLADAKEGQFKTSTPMDGPAILRRLASEAGTAMITNECGNAEKRDELITAIRAAVAETKPYDQPEWLEGLDADGLRAEVSRRIAELGVTPEDADKALDESGLQSVAKSSETELRHILANWQTVNEAMKGGE